MVSVRNLPPGAGACPLPGAGACPLPGAGACPLPGAGACPRLALGFALLITACAPPEPTDPEPIPPGPYSSLEERPCPEDTALTWENFGEPFMRNWCTGCHSSELDETRRAGAPVGVDFNSHDAVIAHLDRIWARAGDQNNTMPPASDPAPGERDRLGEWLACGAKSREALHNP